MSEHTPGSTTASNDMSMKTTEYLFTLAFKTEECRELAAHWLRTWDDLLAACEAARVLTEWLLSEEGWNLSADVVRDVEEVKDCTTAAIAKARAAEGA